MVRCAGCRVIRVGYEMAAGNLDGDTLASRIGVNARKTGWNVSS